MQIPNCHFEEAGQPRASKRAGISNREWARGYGTIRELPQKPHLVWHHTDSCSLDPAILLVCFPAIERGNTTHLELIDPMQPLLCIVVAFMVLTRGIQAQGHMVMIQTSFVIRQRPPFFGMK